MPGRHRREIVRRRDTYEAIVREIVEDGFRDGAFGVVDACAAALALLGALNWTSVWWRPGGGWSSDEVEETFSGIFLQGLRKRPVEERHG